MRRLVPALLLTLAPLAGAWAQPGPEQRIQAAREQAGQTGIPVALLDAKVAEGRAKNVPPDRIAAAVERRLDALTRARVAMTGPGRAPAVSAADLSVGADALEAGVAPGVLGQLAASAPGNRRAQAIAVLAELVHEGMPSDRALQQVTAALAGDPDALRRLPGEASASNNGRGPPATRGNSGEHGQGRGRGNGGGPPSSVPGPK
ncbi:MAG TPA: hypothetical protein VFQ39_05080, partial [Longimicrobium sp.]|nr:hypothetical protein [Longimicrobium sp.]